MSAGSRPEGQYRATFLISGTFLILMIGLRYDVGGDWIQYGWILDDIGQRDLGSALTFTEPGYAFINWVSYQLGFGIWAVNLACAIIFTSGLISLCRWQSNPPLAVLVAVPYLVIVVAMGYTRQSAALGLVMFAITALHRGSLVKMALFIVLATLMHKSAIIVLPLMALTASKRTILNVLGVGLLGVVLYSLVGMVAFNRLTHAYTDQAYGSSGAMVRILMNIVPAILFLSLRKRFGFDPIEERLWTVFSVASIVALAALFVSPSSAAVDRSALYLIPLQVVVFSRLPSALLTPNGRALHVVTAVIAYSFLVEMVWLNYGQWAPLWLPYQNYLFI